MKLISQQLPKMIYWNVAIWLLLKVFKRSKSSHDFCSNSWWSFRCIKQGAVIFRLEICWQQQWFVDINDDIREEFFKFIHCEEGVIGKDLFETVTNTLSEFGLDLMNCRDQGFDGGGRYGGEGKWSVIFRNQNVL